MSNTQTLRNIAQNLITDIQRNDTLSVSFWSDVEKVVRITNEIAAAVYMSRLNTLRYDGKNKKKADLTEKEFLFYLQKLGT